EIFITQHSENKIYNGRRRFYIWMFNKTGWLKAGKSKFVNKLFQWHSILQTNGNSDGKTIQHASHGCPFFCHVDKDLAQRAIAIFARAQEDGLSVNFGFLRKAPAFCWQRTAFHNTRQLALQFSIWRGLHSFLYLFEQFVNSQFSEVHDVGFRLGFHALPASRQVSDFESL